MSFIDDEEKMRDMEILTKEEFLKLYNYISVEEYNETFLDFIKSKVYMMCKDNPQLEDVIYDEINLVLQNKNNPQDLYVLLSDKNYDRVFLVSLLYPNKIESTPEWGFSYSDYLYEPLEKGFRIAYISDIVHPVLWEDITAGYEPEEVMENEGMQLYLKYCKENSITHDKVNSDSFHCDDAMKLYVNEEKEYRTLDFLKEEKEMIEHNLFCYSEGNFICKAKKGYENEFNKERQKLVIINKLIEDEKQKSIKKEDRER